MFEADRDYIVSKELDKIELHLVVDKQPSVFGKIEATLEVVNNSNYLVTLSILDIAEELGVVTITDGIPVYKLKPHSRTILRADNGVKTKIERSYLWYLNKGFGKYAMAVHITTQFFFAQRVIEPKIRKG